MITTDMIIYGTVFFTVILMVCGMYLAVFGKTLSTNSKVNRRYAMMEKGGSREEVLNQLRKEMDQHLRSQDLPLYSILANKVQKANLNVTPQKLIMIMGLITFAAFTVLSIAITTTVPVRVVASLVVGIGSVYLWVSGKADKRIAAIEEQLPDAVELMVRSLRVGHPLSTALNVVADEVADPLGTEIGIIAAKVIRARFKLFRRVKAITAEAQWSGKFLSGFPVLMIIAVLLIKPDYYDNVKETSVFVPGCLIVAGLLGLNVLVMKRLVNIKV